MCARVRVRDHVRAVPHPPDEGPSQRQLVAQCHIWAEHLHLRAIHARRDGRRVALMAKIAHKRLLLGASSSKEARVRVRLTQWHGVCPPCWIRWRGSPRDCPLRDRINLPIAYIKLVTKRSPAQPLARRICFKRPAPQRVLPLTCQPSKRFNPEKATGRVGGPPSGGGSSRARRARARRPLGT